MMNISRKSYINRYNDNSKYRISELITVAQFNAGEVKVIQDNKTYEITINEIKDNIV